MSGFLYFLDQQQTRLTQQQIEDVGLGYAFDATPMFRPVVSSGPSGKPGIVLVRPDSVTRPGYFPKVQTWAKSEVGEYWIGFENDNKPTPADLIRDSPIAGSGVGLNDGNEWLVPIARDYFYSEEASIVIPNTRLPKSFQFKGGEWIVGDVIETHRSLWQLSNEVFDELILSLQNDSDRLMLTQAVQAMSANYFLSDDEVSILSLFGTGPQWMSVLYVFVGMETYLEQLKKKKDAEAIEMSDVG